jgi:predicted peptidase
MKTATVICAAVIATTATTSGGEHEQGSRQQAAKLDREIQVQMGYLLYLPPEYESKDAWPVLFFLHGIGERGTDLNLVKRHGPPKLIEQGRDFPFIVVSPQCPRDQWWQPVELNALLDEIIEQHKVDEDRVYVTGLSMGGFGTWSWVAHAPRRLAAIAPICGGGEPFRTRDFRHVPAWVFHGAQDQAVPLRRSEEMVEALKRNGGQVKFTVYPEAGHDAWTETYDNDELYAWLLEQRRSAEPRNE